VGKRQSQKDWSESYGMDLFEQAMQQIDEECLDLVEDPEQLLLAIAKVEHCYFVLFMSIRKHMSKPHQKVVRPPNRRFKRLVEDNLRDKS
jgi:hypothetical protein